MLNIETNEPHVCQGCDYYNEELDDVCLAFLFFIDKKPDCHNINDYRLENNNKTLFIYQPDIETKQ